MARRYRHDRQVDVEYVYEHDDAAREAQLEARFQQLEQHVSDLIALADQIAALTVGGNPPRRRLVIPRFPKEEEVSDDVSITKPLAGNYQPRERTTEATIEWPFTTNNIPDPVVDWSKPPVFDEELVEKITENQEELQEKVVSTLALLEKDLEESIGFDSYKKLEDGAIDKSANDFVDPFWEFIEDSISKNIWIAHLGGIWKKIVPLLFEEFSKFRFEKINLKYKIDADKKRFIKLLQAMKTRGRVFSTRGV